MKDPTDADRRELERFQREFADYVRDPQSNPPPSGISEERLAVYRRGVAHNIREFMRGNFPLMSATLGDDRFDASFATGRALDGDGVLAFTVDALQSAGGG